MMYLVLSLFLLFFVVIGIYAGKHFKDKSAEGYFMADRSLNGWLVGISAGATANSGFIVVGAVGMGYSMGVSSLLYPLAWMVGDLVFWFLFAEKIRNNKAVSKSITIPQVLVGSDTPNNKLQVISGLIILSLLMVYASSQFIASTKVISSFSSISTLQAMIVSFFFVISYSAWGGFKSSVWTDVVQGIMMIFLTLGMIIWGIYEIGGISSLIASIKSQGASFYDLTGGRSFWLLLLFIIGFGFAGFGFDISQPQVTTRIFAASSIKEVRKSRWIFVGFLHFTWMGMCLIGMIAKIIMPELQDGETALPIMAIEYFPDYIVGMIFASMLATILSSVDSLLISSSSALMIDMGFDDKISLKNKILFYRLSIVLVGLVAVLMALFMQSTVFGAALLAATILSASIGTAMVLIILNLTKSHTTLLISVLVGLFVSVAWRILEYHSIISDGLVGFVVALIVSMSYEKLVVSKR